MSSVQEGQGISWLKMGRVKKLLEDENYRNFVVSRLNKNLDKKLNDEDTHIEDVVSVVVVAIVIMSCYGFCVSLAILLL